MKKYLSFITLLYFFLALSATEVGGHITEDTVWYPQHNPYIITSFLYIESNVTLTILPGTQILGSGGNTGASHHFEWGGLNNDNEPVAKKIIVNGTINAVGTPDNPILFDKYQENSDYRWGGIYFKSNAPISTFEYCEFNNGFVCDYAPYERAWATLEFGNGLINISNCTFTDNYIALASGNLMMDLVVYKCSFDTGDFYSPPFVSSEAIVIGTSDENPPDEDFELIIARCYFTGRSRFTYLAGDLKVLFIFNYLDNFIARAEQDKTKDNNYASVSSYGNYAYNGTRGWGCSSSDSTDVAFARRNKLEKTISDFDALNLYVEGRGTNFVSDNFLIGNTQVTATASEGNDSYIYNNIIETTYPGSSTLEFERQSTSSTGGQIRFFNNLVRYTGANPPGAKIVHIKNTSPYIYNNTFVNYRTMFGATGAGQSVLANNIIDISTNWSSGLSTGYHITFMNNCSIFPIPDAPTYYYVENHLYADPMFADALNGDYSLSPISPCRDAGASRPDLPDFDIRYHKRIAGGSGDNPGVIDIGAYEYGSAYIGGISGNVYDANTGEPVDCAKIEILDKLPEFSDTLGNFAYPSGAGTYTVKVSRWDYEDLIIPDVTVMEVVDVMLDIPLTRSGVANDDNDITPSNQSGFGLRNYPNPFNPETIISFNNPKSSKVNLSIYNIKGQLVKTLLDDEVRAGTQSLVWKGKDSSGKSVASGIYFTKIKTETSTQTKKMLLMK